ncbi:MAG: 4'-phosphopantetheinyl transferase superfamily protein [Clostridia bacterium]|nr:4'-phosphopantetheinyl transferase superfamily protein [Clostridia bacterium]
MKTLENYIFVYIDKFPFPVDSEKVYPQERFFEIESCSNEKVRQQKYFAWKLLEKACKKLGFEFEKLKFIKDKSKWKCDEFCLSISHSGKLVAVAISDKAVGLDLEKVNHARFKNFPPEKMLTGEELSSLQEFEENLRDQNYSRGELFNRAWTAKEAVYKAGECFGFRPSKISLIGQEYTTKTIVCDHEKYYLSIAGEATENMKIDAGKLAIK